MGLQCLSHTHAARPSLWNANASICISCNGFPIRKATYVFGGWNGSFSMKLPKLRMQKWTRGVFRINAMAGSDFYNTLGVTRNSSKAEIKTAYRKLARQYHPDVNKEAGAEAKFKVISNAYETLSDEGKRSIYDKYGEAGLQGGGAGGDSFYGDPFDLFESLFDTMGDMDIMSSLGGMDFRSNRRRNAHGPDEQVELHIEFSEAVFGVKKDVEVSRLEICNTCKGSGNKPGTKPKKCKRCHGRGQVTSSTETLFGEFRQIFPCNTCGGIGHSTTPCSICRGEGRVRKKSTVSVPVPAGVESGNRLRVRSEGSIGKRGGPSGDLILSLYVRPDRQLSRDGSNILYTCKISYIDAVRGVCLNVPTVDGKTELRIPAGTQPGATLVMDKKGGPVLGQPNVRADQLVRIQVSIPRLLDSQERELLEQLSKLRDSHPEPLNAR